MNNIIYPLIKPYIDDDVKARVIAVLDSGYLTEGPITRQLERQFAEYTGAAHALAVCNCTIGLELCLKALNIGPGDEVIVPDYTYPATASAVMTQGATAVIVDIDPDTMLIDYDKLENAVTDRTRAAIPVSIFGNPLDYERLNALRSKTGIPIIEDAACALGASFNGVRVGNLADFSVFSLHPRKFITTGEGGMVTTNHTDKAQWMNAYKHFGMVADAAREQIQFEIVGSNLKLSNLQAAMGAAQMDHIDQLLAQRIALAERYRDMLSGIPGVKLPAITLSGGHSWQSFCVFVEERDNVMAAMRSCGIETQIGTYALHLQPAYRPGKTCVISGSMDNSRYAFDHCLTLPLYHDLDHAGQAYIIDTLDRCVGRRPLPVASQR